MNRIIVFGSKFCPHCEPMKTYLEVCGVGFEYLDITESMQNLKKYLGYRDNRAEFDGIKRENKLGTPVIVINGGEKILFEKTGFDLAKLEA